MAAGVVVMNAADQNEAARFLACLDPGATSFTFQTFDDDQNRKVKNLARVLHGTLPEHWRELERLNARGAGVFVTVNETDGRGRKAENIGRVRAVFVDLDGAPLDPVMRNGLTPHIVTETSPGRWHVYWLVSDFPLNEFSEFQKLLIRRFNSDPSVHDLPRVMRLPGFEHRKGEPFQVRIQSVHECSAYTVADLRSLRPPTSESEPPPNPRKANRNGRRLGGEDNSEWQRLNTEALQNLSAWVPVLFGGSAVGSPSGGYRISSKSLGRDLQEDLSISPEGIKDFGIADQGDPREGRRTPIDIVIEYGKQKDATAAVAWLYARLGLSKADDSGMTEEQANEIARLAALPAIQYDHQRTGSAERLQIRVGTLDQLVEQARLRGHNDRGQGTPLKLVDTVPWSEAVDGEKLIAEMQATIRSHVILSDHQALAVALWIMHTHALEFADHSPRLHIPSPAPRCGKTTLLNTIKSMVPRPLSTENITTAALFRAIEMAQPTLLIDEVDSFLQDNDDMRGLLNAGHGRGGQVIRVVGDDFEPKAFRVWGPVVLAGINRPPIPATLKDRSISIALRRRLPNEKIERLRTNRTAHLEVFGRRVARWVADHQTALIDRDPTLPDELGDRDQDNWRPLIAIADTISALFGERARSAALKITNEEMVDDENASIMALADIAAVFKLKGVERLSSQDLVSALVAMEDRPWAEWRRGEKLTKNSLARLLSTTAS